MDILTNILVKLFEIHPLLGLAGICGCIFAPVVLLAALTHRFVRRQKKSYEPEQVENIQGMRRKRSLFKVGCVGICIIVLGGACISEIVKAFQPVESAYRYEAASVVTTSCMESWKPIPGQDVVLQLNRSQNIPVPDASYSHSFLLQVRPELIEGGRELLIPSEGVQPLLFMLNGPWCTHSTKLKGRLKVLSVQDTTLEAWLEVQGEDKVSNWKYAGVVKFENTTIPH
jgi:hypothetical protein